MTLLLPPVSQGILYTHSVSLTHTHSHTPLISPPVASCPADTHTQITLHANWATSPLTNSCLMSWSSPLQGRACLSPQDGSPELWEEESTVKRSHRVCLHTRSNVIECGSYSLQGSVHMNQKNGYWFFEISPVYKLSKGYLLVEIWDNIHNRAFIGL